MHVCGVHAPHSCVWIASGWFIVYTSTPPNVHTFSNWMQPNALNHQMKKFIFEVMIGHCQIAYLTISKSNPKERKGAEMKLGKNRDTDCAAMTASHHLHFHFQSRLNHEVARCVAVHKSNWQWNAWEPIMEEVDWMDSFCISSAPQELSSIPILGQLFLPLVNLRIVYLHFAVPRMFGLQEVRLKQKIVNQMISWNGHSKWRSDKIKVFFLALQFVQTPLCLTAPCLCIYPLCQ